MTRDVKFEDVFWDPDYTGSQGFEVLLKKMKDGYKMCKDVEDMCKQRSKIEEEYGKSLRRLASKMEGQTEIGTMKYSWEKMREETERVAQEHIELAKQLAEQVSRVSSYLDTHKNTRKHYEEAVKNSIKKRNDLFKKNQDSKKSYETKCKDSEAFDNQMEEWRRVQYNLQKPQDWEKHIGKQVKLQQDADKADRAYKETINLLEDARVRWKQDMIVACQEYERLEEQRIAFVRNELWVHLNLFSQLYVDNDEHNEEVRKALEKCNIEADMMQFIREKRVGNRPPEKIDYEPYKSVFTGKVRPIGGVKSDTLGSRPPQPLPSGNTRGRMHGQPPPTGPR